MIGNDVRHRFTVFQMALEIAILLTGIRSTVNFLPHFRLLQLIPHQRLSQIRSRICIDAEVGLWISQEVIDGTPGADCFEAVSVKAMREYDVPRRMNSEYRSSR